MEEWCWESTPRLRTVLLLKDKKEKKKKERERMYKLIMLMLLWTLLWKLSKRGASPMDGVLMLLCFDPS